MNKCPYCGSDEGLYSKETVRYDQFYTFDGEPTGISEFSDVRIRYETPLYCMSCNKRIGTYQKMFKENV